MEIHGHAATSAGRRGHARKSPMLLKAQPFSSEAHALPVCSLSDDVVADTLLDSRLSTFASAVIDRA
eukprot:11526784-Prorocentrum_lima.AAC.1